MGYLEFYKAFNFLFLLELLKFSKELFSFHKYVHLLIFLLLLKSTFIPRWSDKTQDVIWFSCICWGLFCDWEYGQFWKRYHELLKRRYILLCLAEMFYRCLLGPFWIITSALLLFLCSVSVSMTYQFCESSVMEFLTINVWGSTCNLNFIWVSLQVWVSLHLGHRCSELRCHVGRIFL